MKRLARIFPALVTLSLPACRASATSQDAQPRQEQNGLMEIQLPVQEQVLDNGMRILVVPKKGAPRVFASLWWRVGSVNERPGITGLSHFFEHMMFKGTRRIGTRAPDLDAQLGAQIETVMKEIRAIRLRNLERDRRGRPPDENDQARLKSLLKKVQKLVKERQKITISEHMDKIYSAHGGTRLNASTSYDRTNYYVELPSNKLELFFWMESDRFANPVFREFYPERDVVREERRMRTDSTPTGLIFEAYRSMFWQAHPYSWPVIGWPSDIDDYTIEEARAYYRKHYSPQNCTVILVGDVDPRRAFEFAERYFGRLKRFAKDPEPVITKEPDQVAERRMIAEADANPQWVCRWHGPGQVHPDAAVLDVLMSALAGRTGRLYKRLVLEKEIALNADAWFWGLRYGGVINIDISPKIPPRPKDMDAAFYRTAVEARFAEVEAAALGVIEEVKAKGLTPKEIEKVKNRTIANQVRDLQTTGGIARELGYWETVGTWRDMNAWLRAVQKVTNQDVIRVANRYFRSNGRNILILRRKEEK